MSVTVHIKYEGVEETFTGSVDDVWAGVNRFFSRMIPLFNVARGVVLSADLGEVVRACEDLVAVGEDGAVVLVDRRRLTDSEGLSLMLLGSWVGGRLGVLERVWLSRAELQGWLGKSGKIVGTRLGELCREGLVVKTDEGNFRLSTFGVKRLVEVVLPQVRDKVS